MNELIDNTFKILAKVTNSKTGLLLRINNFESYVMSLVDVNPATFEEFIQSLAHLHRSTGIDYDSVENLPVYKSIVNELDVQSCFIQNVYSINEQNDSVYLFLFSDENNKLFYSENDVCMSILNILSSQVKEIFYETLNKKSLLPFADTKVDADTIVKNWEENFKNLLQISNDLIFMLDKEGCLLKVNESGALLLDYSERELLGKHFLELVPADKNIEVSEAISKMLQSDKVINFTTNLKTKLDRLRSFEITGRTIMRDGKVIGMLGIGNDISKMKKYEDELIKLKPKLTEAKRLISLERARLWQQSSLIEELDRLKSEFVSNISHELRTPLASIIGFSETIVSDPDLPEEMKSEFNKVILNEGKRLAKLINDVLDISKIEGGKIILNKISFDVVEILKEVVDRNNESALRKKITLKFEHPNNPILIEADKEKIAQSFEALINNAIKFTNGDGRVKVIVNNQFKEVEIIISDTGIGIPEKDLPYIFQKFYRVSRPGTEIPGTGIGLVFVKQMIDLHKGMISVQSEIGNGTTFIVKFLKSFKAKN
ncbi:MAG: PAS domain S-box protein [Bacteroidetes bacterium]|nr:PAS domain S-box protein [Bacteroidota bacterium]MCH8034174.1 PAS domain S-box protein [Bacteroidota bacterium]